MKKNLIVPYISELDDLPLEEVSGAMEKSAEFQNIDCVNWPHLYSYKPVTSFSIAYTHRYIYINYYVQGNYLLAINSRDNGPVFEDSCVEFFVQIPGDKEYYNFEFNCIGTALAAKRESRDVFRYFDTEQMKTIKRFSPLGSRPFQEMQGMFSWELLVAIPFDLLGLDGENLPEKLNVNFYKCADASSLPHYLTWNKVETEMPDFHRPEYFGELFFHKTDM